MNVEAPRTMPAGITRPGPLDDPFALGCSRVRKALIHERISSAKFKGVVLVHVTQKGHRTGAANLDWSGVLPKEPVQKPA